MAACTRAGDRLDQNGELLQGMWDTQTVQINWPEIYCQPEKFKCIPKNQHSLMCFLWNINPACCFAKISRNKKISAAQISSGGTPYSITLLKVYPAHWHIKGSANSAAKKHIWVYLIQHFPHVFNHRAMFWKYYSLLFSAPAFYKTDFEKLQETVKAAGGSSCEGQWHAGRAEGEKAKVSCRQEDEALAAMEMGRNLLIRKTIQRDNQADLMTD